MASVDRITTGRPDLTAEAADYGWLRGTRLDDLGRYERREISPQFIDLHWADPDPELLFRATREHQPQYVVAGDYDGSNHTTINERADRLRPHAEHVIVVPHEDGDLSHVPEWAVIGYSVPSEYAGTEIPLRRYRDAEQPIHILGGTPHDQLDLLGRLWIDNVQSLDCNSMHKAATIGAKAWHPATPHWRKLDGEDAVERAYQKSVRNIDTAFQERGLA